MASRDSELDGVVGRMRELDPTGQRTATVLRETLDQLYDGVHTGRYRWDQLYKTEKTHCGTLVEINLQREFAFVDGLSMDYRIDGVEVDCKYSQSLGGWMIPPESMGHVCLLITANDEQATWSLGVVRIDDSILSRGGNRDAKRSITAQGRKQIHWLQQESPLPPNVLLQLPRLVVDEIMAMPNGQQRVDQIFRVAQEKIIGRGVVATVAQQNDYMKRVRYNGGARSHLQPEGIIILGHYDEHRSIAHTLGVPVPDRGESVSVRVAPADGQERDVVRLDGQLWRKARPLDPVVTAPKCPHH